MGRRAVVAAVELPGPAAGGGSAAGCRGLPGRGGPCRRPAPAAAVSSPWLRRGGAVGRVGGGGRGAADGVGVRHSPDRRTGGGCGAPYRRQRALRPILVGVAI